MTDEPQRPSHSGRPLRVAGSIQLLMGLVGLLQRVRVTGQSMQPTLHAGDVVLVRPGARAAPGDLVLAVHPKQPGVHIIKRVLRVQDDGIWVVGDNPLASDDSRSFGLVKQVEGRVLARVHAPPSSKP